MLSFMLQIMVNLVYVFSYLLIVFSFLRPALRSRHRREWISILLLLSGTVLSNLIPFEELNTIMEILLVMGIIRLYCEGTFLHILKCYIFGFVFLGVITAVAGMILGQFYGTAYLTQKESPAGVLSVSLFALAMLLPMCIRVKRSFPRGLQDLTKLEFLQYILISAMDMMILLWIQSLEVKAGGTMFLMRLLTGGGICMQLFFLLRTLALGHVYQEKQRITERYLEEQKLHYEYLENRERDTRKFRHDLRSHIGILQHLIEKKEYGQLEKYFQQMDQRICEAGSLIQTSNGIVDAIVNRFAVEAKQKGLEFTVRGQFPSDCGLESMDLCTILSNLLSNAMEAVLQCKGKCFSLEIRHDEWHIYLVVKNDCNPDLSRSWSSEAAKLPWGTSKEDPIDHGFGLENIRDCVRKNKGWMQIEAEKGSCTVMIELQNKAAGEEDANSDRG